MLSYKKSIPVIGNSKATIPKREHSWDIPGVVQRPAWLTLLHAWRRRWSERSRCWVTDNLRSHYKGFGFSVSLGKLLGGFEQSAFTCFFFFLRFIYGCAGSSVAAYGPFPVGLNVGVSLQWFLLLQSMGSRHVGFGSWGTWVQVVAAHGLQSTGSVVVAHGLGCYLAWGIFPDQGLNLVSHALTRQILYR